MITKQHLGKMVLALTLAYLVVSGNRGLWNLYKLHQEKRDLSAQVSQLSAGINFYQTEYAAYEKNGPFLEKQAREELNLIKPGEMVYRFSKSENH